jgi:glycosyltransferase involved in cell wall biosynthesis
MDWHKLKIAYLHGRPGPHHMSKALAQAISAEFHFIDEFARWHDLPLPAWKRYVRWMQNAWHFPYEDFDAIFLDGPHVWPPIGKLLRRIHTPLIPRLANETMYFLYSGYLNGWKANLMKYAFAHYDAFIAAGQMEARLAEAVLGEKCPPVFTTINGIPDEKVENARPKKDFSSPTVLLIAHGASGWRTFYKGLDLWMATLERVAARFPHIKGWVVGHWDPAEIQRLFQLYPRSPVEFLGSLSDIQPILQKAGLYLHLGRGDAFPNVVLEVMAAGLPAIVSEWTGAAEAVEQVWPEGVVPLSVEKATEAVVRYFSLTETEKRALSEKSATLIREKYRLSQAIAGFQSAFAEALKVVGLL